MPVPTWDCPELAMLYDQPVDVTTTNVVSEDIWKKFDLDFPQPVSFDGTNGYRYYGGGIENGIISSSSSSSSYSSSSTTYPDIYERSGTLSLYEKLGSSSPLLSSTSFTSSSFTSLSSTSRIEAREIRHHDCMWAGLCISKEHNRTHPAKKKDVHNNNNNNTSKRLAVPAGRSLLINRKQQTVGCNTVGSATSSSSSSSNNTMSTSLTKNLESDGDSTRPETPQSCESESEDEEEDEDDDEDDEEEEEGEEEEEEEEEEMPRFKHDSISINDKLSEYVRVGEIHQSSIVSVSDVTGQKLLPIKIRRVTKSGQQQQQQQKQKQKQQQLNDHAKQMQILGVKYTKNEEKSKSKKVHFYHNNNNNNNNVGGGNGNNRQDFKRSTTNTVYNTQNNNNSNNCTNIVSLGDHCYHLNQTSSSKKLEHLGVQTPSDSEEEIDVVTFDKPSCRPASLPTNPSLADKQHFQKTVTSALKEKAPPRPRGRPPSTSTPRKRTAQSETAIKRPAKKPKQKSTTSYQKRNNNRTNNNNNVSQDNKNNVTAETDVNYCNSRVSIDTDNCCSSNDTNDDSVVNDRRRSSGSDKNNSTTSTSHTTSTTTTTTTTTTIKGGSNVSSKESSNNVTSTSSRSTSSDDEPDTEKRSLHNNMERQRRIELRNAFEDLRLLVPEVAMKEKAPKVVILRQAAIYCDMLTEFDQSTTSIVEELKMEQEQLRSRLSLLRRNFRTERTVAEVRTSNHHNRRTRRRSGQQG